MSAHSQTEHPQQQVHGGLTMKRNLSFCLLLALVALGLSLSLNSSRAAAVTFTKDVAPIIQNKCMGCHRPGEVAPMSLMSYREVRPWARSIREQIVSRTMPPWFADAKHTEFANDPRLSQKEIDTIVNWVENGAPEGNPKDMPPNPTFTNGWQIGKPDVVLPMTVEYEIPAAGTIPYKYFAIPTNFTEDKYVQFAEIRQGDRAHMHHVIVSVLYPEYGNLPPAGEIQPNMIGSLRRSGGADSDGRLMGWAPGEAPLELRPGQAKLVKKGSVLIFQVHYVTNGEPGKDRTSVGLIFSKAPVEKRVITAAAVQAGFAIPPGAPNHEVTSEYAFKEDSHIDSLHPHMHMRGKDFKYTLVYADGKTKELLSVPKYDFGWQLTYVFKEEVFAPKGSKLVCVAHYDNSLNNKFNPDATATVRWGDQTWEEMMIGYVDYTLDKQDLRKPQPNAASSSSGQ
jgi:mono/diheme cytochrome c family protein